MKQRLEMYISLLSFSLPQPAPLQTYLAPTPIPNPAITNKPIKLCTVNPLRISTKPSSSSRIPDIAIAWAPMMSSNRAFSTATTATQYVGNSGAAYEAVDRSGRDTLR